ncbi:hypothetical protein F4821DRAFT_279670 [Hypoxylon rubiginosum]|uniref:Uncharacterized protein n=1 Tax=Hypoxylon rubiginosum TaxID=110542 RepID=A0ACC0CWU4_9PEZI|nr:hypothetical protein F4821DRAFT_279670 [Hypoxylon rubiginosum]
MHRRKSQLLDRRKSTSSVRSVHLEHINPATAERDARAAATQAFARSQGHSATDATLWPPSRTNQSSKNDGTHHNRNSYSSLHRQQSIRFVPSRTSRTIRSHTMTSDITPDPNLSTPRTSTATNSREPRSMSRASATGIVSAAKGMAGDYINSLFVGEEHYTPEDDVASLPSSYRKIRKSRSMITSSGVSVTSRNYTQASTSTVADRMPAPSIGSSILERDENIPPAGLKAPKSMSFLRNRRDYPALFSQRRGGVSKGLFSDGGTRASDNRERPLKSQPSTFLRPKSMGADKFRMSMRDTSNDAAPVDERLPKDGSLRIRARKVSSNFKHKLKSFFNLTKGDSNEASFPPQQIEASRSHNTDWEDEEINEDAFPFQSAYDEAAISRVPSGVPSLHAVPSNQQLRSRQGSLESLNSEKRASDDRSRVTSWSNSDTNTINTMHSNREQQRLSIIREDGVHFPSSSVGLMSAGSRTGSSSHAKNSNKSVRHLPPPIPHQPATVDSQRIYSALMKKLNDTDQRSQNSEVQRQRSIDDFINSGVPPPRGSSRDYIVRGANTPPTIRRVMPESLLIASKSAGKKPVTRSLREGIDESPLHSMSGSLRRRFPPSASAPGAYEDEGFKDGGDIPPIPRIEAPTPPPRALSNRSSAFFASPTCHLFRTQSPYRRAIQDSMKAESEKSQLKSPEFNPWMGSLSSLPIRRPSMCESDMDKKMQYAKSIYSSNTEDPITTSSKNQVDNFPVPSNTHGDATIFIDPPVYRPTPPPVPKHREASSSSSVEWKTWLSANVSKLEGSPNGVNTSVLEYVVPSSRSSGHVREQAQINDEDDQSPVEVYKPTGANGVLAPIEHNARASSQASRRISNSRSLNTFYDRGNKEAESPAIQSRNVLCSTPSLASMGSTQEENISTEPARKGVFDSLRRRSLAHRPSLNTLPGNPTSRKLVKKQPGLKSYTTPTPSPRLTAGADKQYSNLSGTPDSKSKLGIAASTKSENVSPRAGAGAGADEDPYDTQGSGVLGPGVEGSPQTFGSKKIVDLFLSSRRRRMASGGEEGSSMFL